jgi:dipeptidyl-peptidase 4
VTDQINYDTIYTERYMGQLKDDPAGYRGSDVTKCGRKSARSAVDRARHRRRQRALPEQRADDQRADQCGQTIQLMIYPNKTHSIAGSDARDHLFHMIEDHFERELK